MSYEWDEDKNRRNLRKHKISFETAKLVFDDPHGRTVLDQIVDGEERWQTMGMIAGAIVVVAHAYRAEGENEAIRIISARNATPSERRAYETYKATGQRNSRSQADEG